MTIFLAQKNRIFQDFKNFQQQIIDFCICILYDVMFARSTKHLYSQDLNSQYITTKLSLCKKRRSRITSYSYLQSRKVRWLREMFPMPCIISSSSDFWFNLTIFRNSFQNYEQHAIFQLEITKLALYSIHQVRYI